jgi:acyl-CoA-dependent ceramide synthase
MIAWIYLRHYLNLKVLWSEFNEFKTVGPYELDWVTEQYKCWISHYISTALLASLQALNLFWLYNIFRIAYRFIFLNALDDDRSDNDENEYNAEQALDALQKQKQLALDAASNGIANGFSKLTNGKTTSTESPKEGTTKRKANGRKA